jgi:hypothetical protein
LLILCISLKVKVDKLMHSELIFVIARIPPQAGDEAIRVWKSKKIASPYGPAMTVSSSGGKARRYSM